MESKTLAWAGIIASAAGLLYSIKAKSRPGMVLAGFGLAMGIHKLLRPEGFFSPARAAVVDAAGLPAGADVSLLEKALGVLGRATGMEPPASVQTVTDRGATDGPFLGNPKNVLGIAGKIRSPLEGAILKVPIFADTVEIDAAIENQSNEVREGIPVARVLQYRGGPLKAPTIVTVEGAPVTLKPGEFRTVIMRIPPKESASGKVDVALQWGKYTLDRVTFETKVGLF